MIIHRHPIPARTPPERTREGKIHAIGSADPSRKTHATGRLKNRASEAKKQVFSKNRSKQEKLIWAEVAL